MPWLGENLARPVREVAREAGATGLTLVPCGPIAVAPIHAAPWSEKSDQRCLIDELEVRFAQSAVIAASGIRRAAERESADTVLVALADPTRDLAAAAPEVQEIARHFPQQSQQLAVRARANASFFSENAMDATHLHLACHGRGGLLDSDNPPAVLLSDGWLPASEITEIADLRARLVVVSACQSSVGTIADLADEAISIGSVMMVAGAACVIASLWPVHDLATGFLMTRLYEELFSESRHPPEALRRAQSWLRCLSGPEEQDFLDRHSALRAEFNKRADRDGDTGRRPVLQRSGVRPYAHPYYWAGFVAVGA